MKTPVDGISSDTGRLTADGSARGDTMHDPVSLNLREARGSLRGGGTSDEEIPSSIDGDPLSENDAETAPGQASRSPSPVPAPATPRIPVNMLYLFSGIERKADLRHYLVTKGAEMGFEVAVMEMDTARNPNHDLTSDELWSSVLEDLASDVYHSLVESPPCETFSRSLFSYGPGPRPLRTRQHPWGFPWLQGRLKDKIETANLLIRRSIEACNVAFDHGVSYMLEFPEDLGLKNGLNPASIWQLPELRETAERTGTLRRAINQDSYGAPYPKPTGLLTTCRPSDTLGGGGMAAV